MAEGRDWVERLRPPVPLPRCPGMTPDERIVVAAIRQMVIDGLEAAGADRAMALRPGGEATVAALRAWLGLLANQAVRQIAVGAPMHCCASPDELSMLIVIDGARRGDFALVHMMLGSMVRRDAIDDIAHAAEVLGHDLTAAGFVLTPRRLSRSPGRQLP